MPLVEHLPGGRVIRPNMDSFPHLERGCINSARIGDCSVYKGHSVAFFLKSGPDFNIARQQSKGIAGYFVHLNMALLYIPAFKLPSFLGQGVESNYRAGACQHWYCIAGSQSFVCAKNRDDIKLCAVIIAKNHGFKVAVLPRYGLKA